MQINNKVLVYGSNGWIGSQFIDILISKNIEYFKGKERVDNLELLKKEILEIKPSHIISFIGRTHGSIDNEVYTTINYLEKKVNYLIIYEIIYFLLCY